MRIATRILIGCLALTVVACQRVVRPKGEAAERELAAEAGRPYELPIDKRPLPELVTEATLSAALAHAFNANGELEATYREWRGALERIPQAGALPDPKIEFSFLFDPANFKSFDGLLNQFAPLTILESIKIMGSQELPAGGKLEARAEAALAEARVAAANFAATKYRLQNRVVAAYAALALNRDLERQTSESLDLLNESHETALHRYHVGGETILATLRKLEVEIESMQSEQRALRLERPALEAALNAALNRPTLAPIGSVAMPEISWPASSDAELLAEAAAHNPELEGLRREIASRGAQQTLAELERRADWMITGGIDTGLFPELGGAVTLPINRERIRAGIAEATQMRMAAEARLRSATADAEARVVTALFVRRDAERVLQAYGEQIMPKARELLDAQLATYGAGGGEFLDILDTQRLMVDFQTLIVRAQADRLRAAGELEELLGRDLFQFAPSNPTDAKPLP